MSANPVRYTATPSSGAVVITGPNSEQLRLTVQNRLSPEERLGGLPYDHNTFGLNISGVNEDADAGRIKRPTTFDEWADAIVREYRANLAYLQSMTLE